MNRRHFLKSMGYAGAAVAASTCLPSFSQNQPILNFGELGVEQAISKRRLALEGHWPSSLRGALFRNGPALFQRNGEHHGHIFDGDGMVHKYTLDGEFLWHQADFVKTNKFKKEQAANQFLYPGVTGNIPRRAAVANNDSVNTANINIQRIGKRYFALWEAGSAFEIDPDNLATKQIVDWAPELKNLPFSAHPLMDSNGQWWNIGSLVYNGLSQVIIYQLDRQGHMLRYKLVKLNQPGYMHAFTLTQRYIVLLNTACLVNGGGSSFIDSMSYAEDGASQLVIIDKETLTVKRTVDIPANFVFHFGNSFEINDELHITMAEYSNADIMLKGMGVGEQPTLGQKQYDSLLVAYRVNMKTGQWQKDNSAIDMEFPQYKQAEPYIPQTIIGTGTSANKDSGMSNALVAINMTSQQSQRYNYSANVVTEEPLFIKCQKGNDYIIQTYLDKEKRHSGVALFKPEAIEAGPIARAVVDRALPIGFHGCYVTGANLS